MSPGEGDELQGEHLPSAPLGNLRLRAGILGRVREFFGERGVLEVETPLLCHAGAIDEHLEPIPVEWHPGGPAGDAERLYLVTSPEHSMKRLLAAGSGPIYQITRSFRDGERGRLHNPEFTILEWYRPGWDHEALMDEVEALVRGVFRLPGVALGDMAAEADRPFERIAYREAFIRAVGIDPFRASLAELASEATRRGAMPAGPAGAERDGWLNILLALSVEPTLGSGRFTFLVDYPPSQAALARVRPGDPPVAERFELYIRGTEIANGYHELTDAREQERRFVEARDRRAAASRPLLPMDPRFLRALEAGLPSSAGVALGVDRLVMLAAGASRIDDVLAFPIERA